MTGQENNKGRGLGAFLLRKVGRWLPDGLFLRLNYRQIFGIFPDLKRPTRFTEVVLWTKLRDRNPLYHKLSDKAEVKDYVASLIGEEYVLRGRFFSTLFTFLMMLLKNDSWYCGYFPEYSSKARQVPVSWILENTRGKTRLIDLLIRCCPRAARPLYKIVSR